MAKQKAKARNRLACSARATGKTGAPVCVRTGCCTGKVMPVRAETFFAEA